MDAEIDSCPTPFQLMKNCGMASEDFTKGGAFTGFEFSSPKANEIESDGVCGSDVMINGSDEVPEDSVLVNPNSVGHLVGEELGECASNLLMNDIEVGDKVSDDGEKLAEDSETEFSEKLENITKSEDFVCEAVDDNCSNPQANCREDEQDVKIVSDSNVAVGEFEELKADALVLASPDENIASNTSMSSDLVPSSQNLLEGNSHWKNAAMASSFVMVGSVEINCNEVVSSLPYDDAIISFHLFPSFENIRLDTKVKSSPQSSCVQGTEAEAEAESENGATADEDTRLSCLSDDQGNLDHVSDVDEDENNGSPGQEVEVVDEIKSGSSFGTLESSILDSAEPLNVAPEVVGFEPVYSDGSLSYEEDTQSSCFSDAQESIMNHASELDEDESEGSTCEEAQAIDEISWDSSFGTRSSTPDSAETLNIVSESGFGPFYFARIPRYEDEFIREKINHARSLVDEITRTRNSLRDQIQTTKAACKEMSSNLSAAKAEARTARELLKLKTKEIETVQSMIKKAEDALTIDEIGIRINKLAHKMAHETLPLNEEEQLIRDIKKLAQLRDQLSRDPAKQGELQLALDQKGEAEQRLPVLINNIDERAATELVETVKDDHEPAKGAKKKRKNRKTKTKSPVAAAAAALPDDQESVSGGVELAGSKDSGELDFADARESHERSEELEEEIAEKLTEEEEEFRLKEQIRLEEMAKQEIALARKKRRAERTQARAAVRAQKEAEKEEKEREKKSRKNKKKKKKNKKAAAEEEAKTEADFEEEPQPAVTDETPADVPETPEESNPTPTEPQKRPPSKKQKKAKTIIPPPLRKRGKGKMEMCVWSIIATVIIVLVLFLFLLAPGNCGYPGKKLGMERFS